MFLLGCYTFALILRIFGKCFWVLEKVNLCLGCKSTFYFLFTNYFYFNFFIFDRGHSLINCFLLTIPWGTFGNIFLRTNLIKLLFEAKLILLIRWLVENILWMADRLDHNLRFGSPKIIMWARFFILLIFIANFLLFLDFIYTHWIRFASIYCALVGWFINL